MLKKILLSAALVIAGLLVVVALQPDDFRVTRSAVISAPAPAVFEQINNFQRWNDWSPWARLDPQAKNTFEGPPSGVGATFAWAGNHEVGEGRMTITESRAAELIRMKLEFIKPMAATNITEFSFRPKGEQTEVTWSMAGRNNFIGKAVGLIFNCEKMVGGRFEQGLANLNATVAAAAP